MSLVQQLNAIIRGILADCPDYVLGTISSDQEFHRLAKHVTLTATYLIPDLEMDSLPLVTVLLQDHLCPQYQIAPAVTLERHPTCAGQGLFRNLVAPELELCEHDPTSPNHLVSSQYRYPLAEGVSPDQVRYTDRALEARRKQVRALRKIPFYDQGTQEWLDQRKGCLTATAMTVILNQDSYQSPYGMLLDKCGRGTKFSGNNDTQHGSMLEEVGVLWYQHRYDVQVMEHGLIGHPEHSFLGASPDGICTKYSRDGTGCSRLVGRLLEIKFPSRRHLKSKGRLNGDIVPHHYYTQMQAQCFATGLAECDFLQCKASQYPNWDAYLEDTHPVIPTLSKDTGLEKGVLIQLFLRIDPPGVSQVPLDDEDRDAKINLERRLSAKYIYPPRLHMTAAECQAWIADQVLNYHQHEHYEQYMIDKVVYWRLDQVSCHLVHAEPEWQEEVVPIAEQFWSYVEFYRKHADLLDDLQEVGDENQWDSATIFRLAEQHYHAHQKRSGGRKQKSVAAREPL